MVFLPLFFYLLLTILSLLYYALHRHNTYFERHNIVYEKPHMLFGNTYLVGKTQPLQQPFIDFYQKFKDKARFGGFYFNLRKVFVLFDLDLIQQMITDYNNFPSRGIYYNEKDDPLSGHLLNLEGPKWKKMRAKLTPTFSSGKMKYMFPCVMEVGVRFIQVISQLLESNKTEDGLEFCELSTCFTTDTIGSCAFGLECNSLKDPNTEFRLMGRKVIGTRRHGNLIFFFCQAFPNLARKMGIAMLPLEVSDFMMNVVKQTVEYRERERVQKNDFMNLLIEMKNRNGMEELSMEDIAAQALIFFVAGFETSSSTMSFTLYELALHQDIQEKARKEINNVLSKYNNELTYEGLMDLKYLQQIVYGKKKC